MENKKDSKGILVIIIVALILLVICLIAYIVFEHVNLKNENNNTNLITSIDDLPKKSDDGVIIEGELEDLINSNDLSKISASNNFKNYVITVGDVDLIFNCNNFDNEYNECTQGSISINNNEIYTFDMYYMYPYILITDKYLIIIGSNAYEDTMYIFNKDGEKITTLENIVNFYKTTLTSVDQIKLNPVIKENKLYFASIKDDKTLTLNYIDLNEKVLKQNNIFDFEGYTGEF